MDSRVAKLSYEWHQIMCFTIHRVGGNGALVLCLDYPKNAQHQLESKLGAADMSNSWIWHGILLKTVRDMYDLSIWSLRDFVRDAELTRTSELRPRVFQPRFVHLHEIARHSIHSDEILNIAICTAKRLKEGCQELARLNSESVK
jgi:hypothetical protein